MISTAPYSLKALITSGLLLLTLVANSQEDSLRVVDLQSVTVNALALPSDNFAFPGMVGRIDQTSLANTDPTIITPALNKIPGVYMHSGALNTNRITVRGIGSRTPFATNKIRAFYGEIPLTDGGGETTIEDIDLSLIQNVEVQKGPSSSSYGAGLGGVILLRPQQPSKSSLTLNAGAGSFGLRRYGGLLQHTQNGKSLIMGFQTQHADGYRDNNTLDRSNYFLGYTQTGKRSDTHIMVLHTRQKAFIPSALNEEDYRNEPTKAAFTWGQAKGFEDYDKTLLGIYRDRRLSENLQLKYALYLNHRDNYEPRPFNILDDQVIGGGGRWRVIWETHNFTLQSGLELYRDTYEWQTYENLYESFDRGSVQGDLLSDNKEIRYYQNYFVQSRWQIMEQTTLEAGVNINQTGYRFNTTARNEESTKFDLIVSPRISLIQSLGPAHRLYATLSHGFSPPSVEETLTEAGNFNTDIQPETGWNREIGFRGNHQRVNYELSIYSMDIQNLLVTRRTAEDITFGENAGRTLHNGLETQVTWLALAHADHQLTLSGSYALNAFRFQTFVDDGQDYSGNDLTGVPSYQSSFTSDYEWKWLNATLEFLSFGDVPVTDDNQVLAEGYSLLNLNLSGQYDIGPWNLKLSWRMNNILDEDYASMVNVNAQGFGGSAPRYYYPGLPGNHLLTVRISHKLP